MHVMDCSCIAIFLCGIRWRHSKPPNSGPHFLVNFFYQHGFGRYFCHLLEDWMCFTTQ